ncbi:MAG: signal peptidase I [Candidatus Methanofastidiosia archaeon]
MKAASTAQDLSYVLLLLFFFPVIASGLLQYPVGMSYVETSSMEPQLKEGDGFFIIPSQLVSSFSVGDVVVFNAENYPYKFLTHRIVGETPQGFITQGDNNTFTDQGGTYVEPYVKHEQIVGKVLQFNGNIVTIPYFGTIIFSLSNFLSSLSTKLFLFIGVSSGSDRLGQLIVGFGLLSFIAIVTDLLSLKKKKPKYNRETKNEAKSQHTIYLFFIIFIVFATTVSVMSMSQSNKVDLIATEGSTNTRAVHLGDTVEQFLDITNRGFLPIHVFVQGRDSIVSLSTTSFTLRNGETRRVAYEVTAPRTPGYYQEYISVDVYMGILPYDATTTLREQSKYLPIIIMDLLALVLSIPIFVALRNEMKLMARKPSKGHNKPSNI